MMKARPPKLAEKILSQLQYDDVWKTTLGDFQEYYLYKVEKEGVKAANRWYWQQVFKYAPSKIIHKLYWGAAMFKNYLTVAYRNLFKNKGYSFINVSGLTIGLASFLLIGIFVAHELSYDSHHKDSDQIYRIVRNAPNELYLGSTWFGVNPMPLSIGLAHDFPGIEASTAISDINALISYNNNPFFEMGIATDQEYFKVFSDSWISGDPKTALSDPKSILLTESLAKKYFGNTNPIGQSFLITPDYEQPLLRTVTGLVKDNPTNSHLQFSFIIPLHSLDGYERLSTFWGNNDIYSYIKTDPKVDLSELEERISSYSDNFKKQLSYFSENPENLPDFKLQPIRDIHLKSSHINFNLGKTSDIKYIYILSIIALIILLIGCVNYMNLATARSMTRAKEIGVRKMNGAFRSNIMMQFSSEAILFSFLSILIAFFIVFYFLEPFTTLLDRTISSDVFLNPLFGMILIFVGLVVGIISGSYPAFYMSALKPAGIFKNETKGGKGNRKFRNLLVIAQFTITNILIISSIVIFQQLNYMETKDSGFNKDQILTVKVIDPELMNQYDVLESLLESNSNIAEVSSARNLPSEIRSQTSGIRWTGKSEDEVLRTYHGQVNTDYLEMLDIKLLAGRTFERGKDSYTSNSYIVNETMVKNIGWTPEEAIGKDFTLWRRDGTIIGVVQDFNFLSYHMKVAPLLLRYEDISGRGSVLLKVNTENLSETIAYIEEQFLKLSPDYPFEYSFLDDEFNNMYRTEQSLGKIFNYFTMLALFIAFMGLFGLAAFMMEQRTKEIGIRKVLGADIFQIVRMLNKDFLKLIGLSFIFSIPIGWFLSNSWLGSFAYKISVGPTVFISTALISFSIAIITVSFKSIKTAKANPVDSLKSE